MRDSGINKKNGAGRRDLRTLLWTLLQSKYDIKIHSLAYLGIISVLKSLYRTFNLDLRDKINGWERISSKVLKSPKISKLTYAKFVALKSAMPSPSQKNGMKIVI